MGIHPGHSGDAQTASRRCVAGARQARRRWLSWPGAALCRSLADPVLPCPVVPHPSGGDLASTSLGAVDAISPPTEVGEDLLLAAVGAVALAGVEDDLADPDVGRRDLDAFVF